LYLKNLVQNIMNVGWNFSKTKTNQA